MMFALFFMIAFVTGLQNPMGVIVKNQFQASNLLSQLGILPILSPMLSWEFLQG
jgi:FHS family L-fucose permease-like MFS transporter